MLTRDEIDQSIAELRASPWARRYEAERAARLRELMERRAKIPPDELARLDREAMQRLKAWAAGDYSSHHTSPPSAA